MEYSAGPLDPIAPLRAALRGHYEIQREIGQGAFATVYLARDLKHERKVALKVLNADPSSDTAELRFIREIRMLARLQHPNILPLHDSGHVEALLYYVMPYVTGETLRQRIDRERQLPIEDAVCIAQEAADALAYAHGQGIIHRDIKPENILLSGGHAIVADFGIARAIDVAGIRQLTRTGLGSPGTPAYMAPEQLLAEREIDARADTYSLGCVLYEMLTGKPPFAGKEAFVKRFTEPPPVPSKARGAIPVWVDAIVTMSLARNPADRFATAAEMARALSLGLARERTTPVASPVLRAPTDASRKLRESDDELADATKGAERTSPIDASDVRPRQRTVAAVGRQVATSFRTHPVLASALVLVLVLAVVGAWSEGRHRVASAFGRGPTLDSARFVVLPLVANGRASEPVAAQATDQLYAALRNWSGLDLVSDLKVEETLRDNGGPPETLTEAVRIATRLGARHLVWGRMLASGDSFVPRAELYDVTDPGRSRVEVVLNPTAVDSYTNAVLSFIAPPGRPLAALGGDGRTRNYEAWQAYNRGHIALDRWQLAVAQSEFARAVDADPKFLPARLWLAQILEWRNLAAPAEWRQNAERAAGAASSLSPRDRLVAMALASMAKGLYPAACASYRGLTALDSTDFIGWYGLGECQGLDGAVVRDASSPSHWRWRSSFHAALESFKHALLRDPGAYALFSYQRLRRLLPITALNLRVDNPDLTRFAAYPSLSADTLAFVPYPIATINSGLPPEAISTRNQALNRNLEVLFSLVSEWVRAYPTNPDAHEALADVLEARGDIFDQRGALAPALVEAQTGEQLSHDDQQRLRLVVRQARIRFKRGDFRAARQIADSLFATGDKLDNNETGDLISLAALTGRIKQMATEARAVTIPGSVDGIDIPTVLRDISAELFAISALGVCGDTLSSLKRNLDQQAQSSIAEEQRARVVGALTVRPLSFMVPCTAGASALKIPPTSDKLYALQQAFARKDAAGIKKTFQAIAQTRRSLRPGDFSLDYTYQEAWIRVQVGDTAGAIVQLDRSLNGLAALSAAGLREAAAAAAAGRAMALRAELAARTGDPATARKWAAALTDLWLHADPLLQPSLARMKHLAVTGQLP